MRADPVNVDGDVVSVDVSKRTVKIKKDSDGSEVEYTLTASAMVRVDGKPVELDAFKKLAEAKQAAKGKLPGRVRYHPDKGALGLWGWDKTDRP